MSENFTDYHMTPLPPATNEPNPYLPYIIGVIVIAILLFVLYIWLTKE